MTTIVIVVNGMGCDLDISPDAALSTLVAPALEATQNDPRRFPPEWEFRNRYALERTQNDPRRFPPEWEFRNGYGIEQPLTRLVRDVQFHPETGPKLWLYPRAGVGA